jgi:hypothetical protein
MPVPSGSSSPATDADFEPTADMLVHDYDDERTLDEEEAMSNDESVANELDDLQKERDMPIEQLLAMYGYDPNQKHPPTTVANPTAAVAAAEAAGCNSSSSTDDEEDDETVKADGNGDAVADNKNLSAAMLSTSRLLRSDDIIGSSDEEDEDYDPDDENEYWKKNVQVGADYQAFVPEGFSAYGEGRVYENDDQLIWDPSLLEDLTVEHYVHEIHRHDLSIGQGVYSVPTGAHTKDNEQALYLLLQCEYNVREALHRHGNQLPPPQDPLSLWSEEECRNFENGLRTYGKDFFQIQQNKVKTRSVQDLVQFYYFWKKTERHDAFAARTRLEKKKYTLHPGITDYMDRFLDEQDNPVSVDIPALSGVEQLDTFTAVYSSITSEGHLPSRRTLSSSADVTSAATAAAKPLPVKLAPGDTEQVPSSSDLLPSSLNSSVESKPETLLVPSDTSQLLVGGVEQVVESHTRSTGQVTRARSEAVQPCQPSSDIIKVSSLTANPTVQADTANDLTSTEMVLGASTSTRIDVTAVPPGGQSGVSCVETRIDVTAVPPGGQSSVSCVETADEQPSLVINYSDLMEQSHTLSTTESLPLSIDTNTTVADEAEMCITETGNSSCPVTDVISATTACTGTSSSAEVVVHSDMSATAGSLPAIDRVSPVVMAVPVVAMDPDDASQAPQQGCSISEESTIPCHTVPCSATAAVHGLLQASSTGLDTSLAVCEISQSGFSADLTLATSSLTPAVCLPDPVVSMDQEPCLMDVDDPQHTMTELVVGEFGLVVNERVPKSDYVMTGIEVVTTDVTTVSGDIQSVVTSSMSGSSLMTSSCISNSSCHSLVLENSVACDPSTSADAVTISVGAASTGYSDATSAASVASPIISVSATVDCTCPVASATVCPTDVDNNSSQLLIATTVEAAGPECVSVPTEMDVSVEVTEHMPFNVNSSAVSVAVVIPSNVCQHISTESTRVSTDITLLSNSECQSAVADARLPSVLSPLAVLSTSSPPSTTLPFPSVLCPGSVLADTDGNVSVADASPAGSDLASTALVTSVPLAISEILCDPEMTTVPFMQPNSDPSVSAGTFEQTSDIPSGDQQLSTSVSLQAVVQHSAIITPTPTDNIGYQWSLDSVVSHNEASNVEDSLKLALPSNCAEDHMSIDTYDLTTNSSEVGSMLGKPHDVVADGQPVSASDDAHNDNCQVTPPPSFTSKVSSDLHCQSLLS